MPEGWIDRQIIVKLTSSEARGVEIFATLQEVRRWDNALGDKRTGNRTDYVLPLEFCT